MSVCEFVQIIRLISARYLVSIIRQILFGALHNTVLSSLHRIKQVFQVLQQRKKQMGFTAYALSANVEICRCFKSNVHPGRRQTTKYVPILYIGLFMEHTINSP